MRRKRPKSEPLQRYWQNLAEEEEEKKKQDQVQLDPGYAMYLAWRASCQQGGKENGPLGGGDVEVNENAAGAGVRENGSATEGGSEVDESSTEGGAEGKGTAEAGATKEKGNAAGGGMEGKQGAAGGDAKENKGAAGGDMKERKMEAGGDTKGKKIAAGGVTKGKEIAAGGCGKDKANAAGGREKEKADAGGGREKGKAIAAGGPAHEEGTPAGGSVSQSKLAAGGEAKDGQIAVTGGAKTRSGVTMTEKGQLAAGPSDAKAVVSKGGSGGEEGEANTGTEAQGLGLNGLRKVRTRHEQSRERSVALLPSPSPSPRSAPSSSRIDDVELAGVRSPDRPPIGPNVEQHLAELFASTLVISVPDPRGQKRILQAMTDMLDFQALIRSSEMGQHGAGRFTFEECARAFHIVADGTSRLVAEAQDWQGVQKAAREARKIAKLEDRFRDYLTRTALHYFDLDGKEDPCYCPDTLLHATKNLRHLMQHQPFCDLLKKALGGSFTWYQVLLRALGRRFALFLCFLYEEIDVSDIKRGSRGILDRQENRVLYEAVGALECMYGLGVVNSYVEKLRGESFANPRMDFR